MLNYHSKIPVETKTKESTWNLNEFGSCLVTLFFIFSWSASSITIENNSLRIQKIELNRKIFFLN